MAELKSRVVGSTERSWCRAMQGGTGNAVLALLLSKPVDISRLQNVLNKLQTSHPILRTKLQFNSSSNTFTFITSSSAPTIQIKSYNLSACDNLQNLLSEGQNDSLSPFHMILEHNLNKNAWFNPNPSVPMDLVFASVYALPDMKIWVLVLRLHVSICDRRTAVSVLWELQDLLSEEEGGMVENSKVSTEEIGLAIEDLIPIKKSNKTVWARGMDMMSYSMNSFRLTNLKFKDTKSPRCSQVVNLQLNSTDTWNLLSGCKSRGITLCGVLAAAGMIAAYNASHPGGKRWTDIQSTKYGIATFLDCRPLLDPPLAHRHLGFYQSAILNTHVMKGGEDLWDLATKTFNSFKSSKNGNKHFLDMPDLNVLMSKAIDNPGLTTSSSLRTALMSVFEDTVFDNTSNSQLDKGVEHCLSCASIHGVGPSIALFDTIRDGALDCVCVYPSPLHSRKQMQDLVGNMKAILVEAATVAA